MNQFKTYTSLSVNDIDVAADFYRSRLGLEIKQHPEHDVLLVNTGGDTRFMIYFKEDHTPAIFTVLNFNVDDLESVVGHLSEQGVSFEKLEGTNEKGIAEMGPTKAAWTRDPSGNWIGFFEGMNF